MGRLKTLGVGALLVVGLTATAQAAPVYGEAANLTGTRSVGNGLTVAADPQTPGGWDSGQLDWEITIDWATLTAHYKYTFSGFSEPPSISHIVLDLTPDAVNDPNAVTNAMLDGVLVDPSNLEFGSNSGIDTGVKFDFGPDASGGVYEFTSNRMPVWGDIVIEAGSPNNPNMKVVNTGFGDQTLTDTNYYVARPNGVVVPTPAAAGAGLLLLGGLLMRRRAWEQRQTA